MFRPTGRLRRLTRRLTEALPSLAARCLACALLCSLAPFALVGCSKSADKPRAPSAPVPVRAMQVFQGPATVTGEVVGELRAFREVALRPQVTGWVHNILFQPGQRVREHEVLFIIDPRPYEADLGEAIGAVADAEAMVAHAHQDVARYEPLLPDNAIPRSTYDTAVAAEKSALAGLVQRQAAVARARLDLNNTKVRSPVNGQIGLQQVEVGALATAGQTTLATVSTLDPVFVYFNISESDYLRFVRGSGAQEAAAKEARARPIHLVLPDGSNYPQPGTFDFAERAINTATGTLTLRARFANPQTLLRPGMNVRVQLIYDEIPNAVQVPQRAVTEILGKQFVTLIGPDNRTGQRQVMLGDRVGEMWLVKSGLKPGERIVVDGAQKAPPGTTVAPTMITVAQLDQPVPVQAPAQPPGK